MSFILPQVLLVHSSHRAIRSSSSLRSATCATRRHSSMSLSPLHQPDIYDLDIPPGFGPLRVEQSVRAEHQCQPSTINSFVENSTVARHSGAAGRTANHSQIAYEAAGVGAARQFKKALFGSTSATTTQGPVPNGSSAPQQYNEPDYGEYGDNDSEYGMKSSSPSMQRSSSRLTASPSPAVSPSPSIHKQSVASGKPSTAAPCSDRTEPQARAQQGRSGSGTSASTTTARQQQLHHRSVPAPDYGAYADLDDYGTDSRNSRRIRNSPAKGGRGGAAAGGHSRQGPSRPGRARTPSEGRQSRADATRSTAAVEAELAALRAALEEAEARQVEAQLAVITLETDKNTLQAQLQGMRQQKQQLETMLLFGGDNGSFDNEEEGFDDSIEGSPAMESNGNEHDGST
eukprot:GHUV01005780.1.p1 GENE.GHUV01005780.1~~GHUV01005780.1.p1  ORF type:complete len:401 (+),score=93.88 GHUV01005780.1:1034-2236(+)